MSETLTVLKKPQGGCRVCGPASASERRIMRRSRCRTSSQVGTRKSWVRISASRFLQIDPVPGGSANNYDYAAQDPVNKVDLDGRYYVHEHCDYEVWNDCHDDTYKTVQYRRYFHKVNYVHALVNGVYLAASCAAGAIGVKGLIHHGVRRIAERIGRRVIVRLIPFVDIVAAGSGCLAGMKVIPPGVSF